jgi:hypothetical protein
MTKEEFLNLRQQGKTFSEIGTIFDLTERQVNYRTKSWGLDYSKKKPLNEYYFSGKEKAVYYWAGFLAADGWIEKERNRVGLALQAQDYKHLEKFKNAVESGHDICPFMNNTAFRIRFNSEQMVKDLESKFNITQAKTFTYKMPEFEEPHLFLEFMRGYIDGDGHLEKSASKRVALHLCSANRNFLEEYVELCGILINRIIPQKITLQNNKKGSVYTIRFNLDDSKDILSLLYANSTEKTRLDRKYDTASLVL